MSKYNNIKPIPIDSIPKNEIKRAIHEWAEGDDSMEKLLWTLYEKNIKTSGCHAGSGPWIDFNYQEDLNRIIPLFEVTQNEVGSQIIIQIDGGNPFSGPEWYLSNIGIGIDTMYKDAADVYFNKLIAALDKKKSKDSYFMLRLLEFFIDKESALILRFRHNIDNKFVFYIESRAIPDYRYMYYNEIFTKAGLIEVDNEGGSPSTIHTWKIESNELNDILVKLNSITDYIISNYSLDIPKTEDEIINFISRARFKKKTLNEKDFNEWLKQMKEKMF